MSQRPTYEGGPCKHCGGTTRYRKSRKCLFSSRSDHVVVTEKRRASWRAWYHNNRDENFLAHKREYNHTYWNSEKGQTYYENNKWKYTAARSRRRAALLLATPSWANSEAIKKIYEHCPPGHEVDHIVPLQGELVCGLHVAENLQYLPSFDNRSKGNTFVSH